MKRIILAVFLAFGFLKPVYSQIQLSATTGYQFGSKTYYSNGTLRIDDSQDYMFNLGFEVRPDLIVELSYTFIPTTARMEQFISTNLGNVDVHYWHIGAQSPHVVSEKAELFGLFTLGGTSFVPQDPRYRSENKFSIALGGGAKIWLTDVIGIRLQGRLLAPITWGGITFGTGGAGFTAGSTLLSGDLSGGLVLKLGNR